MAGIESKTDEQYREEAANGLMEFAPEFWKTKEEALEKIDQLVAESNGTRTYESIAHDYEVWNAEPKDPNNEPGPTLGSNYNTYTYITGMAITGDNKTVGENNKINGSNEKKTGFDPFLAKNEIEDLDAYGLSFTWTFDANIRRYYEVLKKIWCSPKAVECSKKIFLSLENCCIDADNIYWKLTDAAIKAYNTVAAVHGVPLFPENGYDGGTEHKTETEYVLKESTDDGIVGMNKNEVAEITVSFMNWITTDLIVRLEETPVNFSLFDPNGEQQASFKASIQKQIEDIKAMVQSISAEVLACVETEVDQTELSAKQSADELSGN